MPRSADTVLLVLLTLPALAQTSAPADRLIQENTVSVLLQGASGTFVGSVFAYLVNSTQ